jgi:hypothetical protein
MGGEVNEALEVTRVAQDANEAVSSAAAGHWDQAADSALHMSEHALGVATGGLFTAGQEVLDGGLHDLGLPSSHELINTGAHATGDALGDALHSAVGDEAALRSVNDFDNGNYLAGIGEMAGGIAHHAESLASDAASSVEHAAADAYHSAESAIEELF